MPLKPELIAHHTAEQLDAEVRSAKDARYRDRVRFILFLARGHSLAGAARLLGWCRRSAQRIRARYNQGGLQALFPIKPKRPKSSGKRPLLDDAQRAELAKLLEGPAPDGGLWTGPKVARWIQAKLNTPEQPNPRRVHNQRGWDYLRRLGFVLRRPRPKHKRGDPTAQAVFKKAQGALPRLLPGEPGPGGVVGDGRAPAGAEADPPAGLV